MGTTTKEKMEKAREKKLLDLVSRLEQKTSLRNLEMALGMKIKEKTGFIPLCTVKERSLLRRLAQQHSPSFLLSMMDTALSKPEVYLVNKLGQEDISLLSFYNNNILIAMQCRKENEEMKHVYIPQYTQEEEKELSPFYKGVLEKLKKKVQNTIESNSS